MCAIHKVNNGKFFIGKKRQYMNLRNLELFTYIASNGIRNVVEDVTITAPNGAGTAMIGSEMSSLNPFSSDEPGDWM